MLATDNAVVGAFLMVMALIFIFREDSHEK